MSNPNPDMRGLARGTPQPSGYIEAEVTDCIRCWIKGEQYTAPEPGTRLLDPRPAILPSGEVLRRTGLSRVTIWHREKLGCFPQRVTLPRAP